MPQGLLTHLNTTATISTSTAIKMLGEVISASGRGTVCYAHWQKIGSKIGLQTKGLNTTALINCCTQVYNKHFNLACLKTAAATYVWFHKSDHPPCASDLLGIYHLQPLDLSYRVTLTDVMCGALLNQASGQNITTLLPQWH